MPAAPIVNFCDILFLRASRDPSALAYRFVADNNSAEFDISVSELDRKVRSIAASLQHKNLHGERVLLAFNHGPEFIYAFYACLALGAIAVPVIPPSRKNANAHLQSVMNDAAPKLVLTNESLVEVFLNQLQLRALKPAEVMYLNGLDSSASEYVAVDVQCQDIAYLQYTSGSTGEAKGVMVSHANLLDNSRSIAAACGTNKDSIAVIWLPFYHDMGLVGGLLQSMFANTAAYFMSPVEFILRPFRWLQLMSDSRATMAVVPNFALELCCNKVSEEQLSSLDLSSLQCVLCGAEPVNALNVKRFSETFSPCGFKYEAIMPCYGLAEATLYVSGRKQKNVGATVLSLETTALAEHQIKSCSPEQHNCQQLISNGVFEESLCIVDPDTGLPLDDDQIGEIWVSGDSVSVGYWQRNSLNTRVFSISTAAELQDKKYFRTGDLGFSRNGELYINGRISDLLVIQNKSYYPQFIEDSVARAHVLLVLGAVAAFSVEQSGSSQLVIVVETSRLGVAEFKNVCKAKEVIEAINCAIFSEFGLSPWSIWLLKPAKILKTPSGKLKRSANKISWLKGEFDSVYRWSRAVG